MFRRNTSVARTEGGVTGDEEDRFERSIGSKQDVVINMGSKVKGRLLH